MKIIQITDTHLQAPGEVLYDLDPLARLHATLDHVRAQHADADLMVLTGDLANDGNEAAYRALQAALADWPHPVRLLLGNHDRRDIFRKVFAQAECDGSGYVQSALVTPAGGDLLLFLDTLSHGDVGGRYCADRRDWLAATLAETPDLPATVFLHHPPVDCGMRHFQHIGLHDSTALMEVLRAHPGGVRHIAFGHIHIPLSGVTRDGIGFSSGRGCSHQFEADFDNPAPDWMEGPLNYTVLTLTPEQVSVRVVDLFEGARRLCPSRPCFGP